MHFSWVQLVPGLPDLLAERVILRLFWLVGLSLLWFADPIWAAVLQVLRVEAADE